MKIDETCVCGARFQLDTGIPEHNEFWCSYDVWRRIHANCEDIHELARLRKWVSDLQTGLYINCVYCGHQYGPREVEVPQDALRRHVAECPEHPMAHLVMDVKTVIANLENKENCGTELSPTEEMVIERLTQAVQKAER